MSVVARGQALFPPKATRDLIARFLSQPNPGPLPSPVQLDALTEREREIMALVAAGLSNDEIGERLYVSPLTAKMHTNQAMTKPGARDRAQLVVPAYRGGLVSPTRPSCRVTVGQVRGAEYDAKARENN